MRALVTGGAGFIGSHLVDRLLAAGHSVIVVDDLSNGSEANLDAARSLAPEQLTFRCHDVRGEDTVELVAEAAADVVYHLAAQADVRVSVARPAFDAGVNVIGSLNVFEGAVRGGSRKVVFAGSGGTLYGAPTVIPTPETEPQRPICPYGVAKKAVGDYLYFYRHAYGLDFTVLALANVYGPRQDPHGEAGVVAIFGDALLNGSTPMIFGDGEQTRDFVYVGDVAEAFLRAATAGDGILGNVGTASETSVNDLFRCMADVTGFAGSARYAPGRLGELRRSALEAKLISGALDWTAEVPLRVGLQLTVDWLRAARDLQGSGR